MQEHSWEEGSGERRRGRWDMRDEIFRETTAGAAPLLDLERCAWMCVLGSVYTCIDA